MDLKDKNPSFSGYRPDIDGLRALAVLSVILFHIDKTALPGGFVGVDIFFVISGYLISNQIFKDLANGHFSLLEFYRRRIQRIVPAMLVVVSVTVLCAQVFLHPSNAELVAESGLWSVFSLANMYFWRSQDTGYFAQASNEFPLLHLWSLGIEEQFYIIWPLILLTSFRVGFRKGFFVTVALFTLFSFSLGEYLFSYDPSFVYYMLPTRAGELLIGALLAYFLLNLKRFKLSQFQAGASSATGLLMIAISLIFLSEDQVFPGFSAILPTAGSALIMLSGYQRSVGTQKLLTKRPLVWVGKVSYSAYLWHWPLLAFFHYGQFTISKISGTAIFLLTFLLAWLTYRFVETPGRNWRKPALQIILKQYVIPSSAVLLLSLISMKLDGYGLRWLSDEYKNKLASLKYEIRPANELDYVCQSKIATSLDAINPKCVIGETNLSGPRAILWGDSNAAHYIGVIGVFARESGFSFRNLQVGSCPPLIGQSLGFVSAGKEPDCEASRPIVSKAIDEHAVVIISANWTDYQRRSNVFMESFFETVRTLASKGKLIIILGKAPVISSYDRLCKEKKLSFPLMTCAPTSNKLSDDILQINEKMRFFAAETTNVKYYQITEYLCPAGQCSAFNLQAKPLYYDASHLSSSGSWEIGEAIYKNEGVPFPFTLISDWSLKNPEASATSLKKTYARVNTGVLSP